MLAYKDVIQSYDEYLIISCDNRDKFVDDKIHMSYSPAINVHNIDENKVHSCAKIYYNEGTAKLGSLKQLNLELNNILIIIPGK